MEGEREERGNKRGRERQRVNYKHDKCDRKSSTHQ